VRVAVRCRPQNDREKSMNSDLIISMKGNQVSIQNPENKKKTDFTFDHAYFMDSSQDQIYNDIGVPVLTKALEGYNGTIFAYGQTGSGKTFSMLGYNSDGIIPQLNKDLFERIGSATENMKFLVTVSYLEIYNEVVRDLLNPSDMDLRIREHPQMGVYVEHLAELVVNSAREIDRLMQQGNKVRQVAETKMNAASSRSHSVFTIKVEQKDMNDSSDKGLYARINLVDLAGSERAASTGATGDRLKEGAAINKSLSALGNVINALADTKKNKGHIPYRDSKLTRILQESLGGNTQTVMLAALSPASVNFDETLSTLQYANRAKNIKNESVKNEDANARIIRELREEIQRLQGMLSGGSGGANMEVSVEQMKKMEQMMASLEHAKKQTWDEKVKASASFQEERRANLAKEGLMEWVMQSLQVENEESTQRVAKLNEQKMQLMKNYKISKDNVDTLKGNLQEKVGEYQRLQREGVTGSSLSALQDEIKSSKQELFSSVEELKQLKEGLKVNADELKREKDAMQTQSLIINEDSELRQLIAEDERKKLMNTHAAQLEEEKVRLQREMAQEREALQEKANLAAFENQQVSADRLLELELQLVQSKSEREYLILKNELLEKHVSALNADLEDLSISMESQLEKQELNQLRVFRAYRRVFQQELDKNIRKYERIMQQSVVDALYLAGKNRELEMELAEIKRGMR